MQRRISITATKKLRTLFSDFVFALNLNKDPEIPYRYLCILRVSLDLIEALLADEVKPPCPDEKEKKQIFFKL